MVLLLALMPLSMCAQQTKFTEMITKEVTFEQQSDENALVLKNIFGSVTVEGYDGNAILLNVEKTIKANNKQDLEFGKQELQLKIINTPSRITVRPGSPYIEFNEDELGFNWCGNKDEDTRYEHRLDFAVKVPNCIKLHLSTINDGEILVKNMKGTFLKVSNVNGGITLKNVTGETDLNCINGNVFINYSNNPSKASKYYALNGDINVSYQRGLSANVSFKSMNGELYTDFDIQGQFTSTKKIQDKHKAKYKYESTPKLQIGEGAIALNFETLNGNVYIKKI